MPARTHARAGEGGERGNDTSGSPGRSGRQNATTRRNMRRGERVTVQGPVKEQQPDGMLAAASGQSGKQAGRQAETHSYGFFSWGPGLQIRGTNFSEEQSVAEWNTHGPLP